MTPIQELIERILDEYPRAKRVAYSGGRSINQSFRELVGALWTSKPIAVRESRLEIVRSVGRGNWADVPWVTLLDRRETDTTQDGAYVALLFRGDGSAVALCVMQGTTRPLKRGEGWAEIQWTREALLQAAEHDLRYAGFELDEPLDLHARTQLSRNYERATAAFKLYERGAVPDDATIEADLECSLAAIDRYIEERQASPNVEADSVEETPQRRDPPRPAPLFNDELVAAAAIDVTLVEQLDSELADRRWGWRERPSALDRLPIGAPLLFVTGLRRTRVERIIVSRVTSALYEERRPFPSERRATTERPFRVTLEAIGEANDLDLSDGLLSRDFVTLLRRAARSADPIVERVRGELPLTPWSAQAQGRTPIRLTARLPTLNSAVREFQRAIRSAGLHAPGGRDGISAFIAALVTKPFVILTGLSGSGKTQLALRLGEWFGEQRMRVVAVRPDWTGPEALFGYPDALQPPIDNCAAWSVPEALEFMLAAYEQPELPHLLVLDEMNLAHVERYFSDFLSGMESGQPVIPDLAFSVKHGWRAHGGRLRRLPLPQNLMVVGTVNIDETTYLFSPKVLDRASTFEIRTAADELRASSTVVASVPAASPRFPAALLRTAQDGDWQLENRPPFWDVLHEQLVKLHGVLAVSGDEFGHRAFRESLRLASVAHAINGSPSDANGRDELDLIVLLKVLPRVHGARARVAPLLLRLLAFAKDPGESLDVLKNVTGEARGAMQLSKTAAKVRRMLKAVELNQFVSFTE